MNVKAKFYVAEVNHRHVPGPGVCAEVVMAPVFGTFDDGDGEANKEWSEHTPSGELKMTITNPAAIDSFAPGEAYFLEFTPAGKVPG